MKNQIITIILVLIAVTAQSQINILRYNDNFSDLKRDSVSKKGLQKIKYIPLTGKATISFGGEIREQLQYYSNINFGDIPPTFYKSITWQLWHRVMAHTNIEISKKIRMFAQLGSTFRFINPNPLTPEIDENKLSLQQAFLDYHFNKNWMVRIGRQELSYGNHRLITFREGPNTRLPFDAAILKYSSGKRNVDVLALTPIISRKDVFDDVSFKDMIVGVYATEKFIQKKFIADYYILNFQSNRRQYNYISGKENRNIVGFRLFSEMPTSNYEIEGTYQFGKFNNQHIKAYSISIDLDHNLNMKSNLILGVAGNYVSGDKNSKDDQLNTYNLLFSKPQYGLAAPIGATNMITVNPYMKIRPTRKSNIYVGTNFMWRQSKQDGTYSPGAIEMRPNPGAVFTSVKKQIGTLFILETNYFVNNHISFAIDASQFLAGNYIKKSGKGKDITYLSFKANYKF
jgi:hypothetical protein